MIAKKQKTVSCPKCQLDTQVMIWTMLDLKQEPELRYRLLAGDINDFYCPACDHEDFLPYPLIINDPHNQQIIIFIPDAPQLTTEELAETQRQLGNLLAESLDDNLPPYVYDTMQLHNLQALTKVLSRPSSLKVDIDLYTILNELDHLPQSIDTIPQRIALFRQAINMVPQQKNAELWASLQNELAKDLVHNRQGDESGNLEQAIYHYKQALEVRSRKDMPKEWAQTTMNLGIAYSHRLKGGRSKNIEIAIDLYYQALEIRNRHEMPIEWAITLINLAVAYGKRIDENRVENIEESIRCYQLALEAISLKEMPSLWVTTTSYLADEYSNRIKGDRAENLEIAIDLYQQALAATSKDSMPLEWGQTIKNLAMAYTYRHRGDQEENQEKAIHLYNQALEVFTQHMLLIEQTQTLMELAVVYTNRIKGDRVENQEKAIELYEKVLKVTAQYTGVFTSIEIETWVNLGTVFWLRISGERAENLEKAKELFEQALKVQINRDLPHTWAQTAVNLANIYCFRMKGSRTENIKQAISLYQQALTVMTISQFPADHLKVQRNLGHLYFIEQSWQKSLAAYQSAINAEKILLASAHTEAGRQAEVGETARLYASSAYLLLKLEQPAQALELLDQGKTRLLNQILALNEVDLTLLSSDQKAIIHDLREAVHALESEMRLPLAMPSRREDRLLARELKDLRGQLNLTIETIRTQHPTFMPEGLQASEILALIPPFGALVAPLFTARGGAVFVIPHGVKRITSDHIIWLDSITDYMLEAWLNGTAEKFGWSKSQAELGLPEWNDEINNIGHLLWEHIIRPIQHRLSTLGVNKGAPILMIPQGGLGILPLHAAWHKIDGEKHYFLDEYTINYASSAYAVSVSQKRLLEEARQQTSLLAIINPTDDLTYTMVEGDLIAKLFFGHPQQILQGRKATIEAVQKSIHGQSYLHFSCHGQYEWHNVMQSSLQLASNTPLTLVDIINKFNLSSARLITLSACETGVTDVGKTPDEYIGLPAGFLQTGAPGVVSCLWAVDELSTALLIGQFYRWHIEKELAPAQALRQAQLWLRDVTLGEVVAFIEQQMIPASINDPFHYLQLKGQKEHLMESFGLNETNCPYAHPYYWAAFVFTGA